MAPDNWLSTLPLFVLLWPVSICLGDVSTEFPRKPIRIVVYMAPGGLVDTTARKFTEVAARYTDAPFFVENKPGAGGLVAIKKVLQLPADGHTLLACTKSNISKIVASGDTSFLNTLDWIAMMMADPECIITRANTDLSDWCSVVADAREKSGQQIWLGPARGGLDHVMAIKTWDASDIRAKWIPKKSGGAALTGLLGGQGVVYVGNPRDALGKPALRVAVVSSPSRLPQFPDSPTFTELGIVGLDHQTMWRGFAIKQGSPSYALDWYDGLFEKVTADPQWRAFWEQGGIRVDYVKGEQFASIVSQDHEEFSHYLGQIGIVQKAATDSWGSVLSDGRGLVLFVGLMAFLTTIMPAARQLGFAGNVGSLLVPLSFLCGSIFCYVVTMQFPRNDGVDTTTIPRLWIFLLILLSVLLGFQAWHHPHRKAKSSAQTSETTRTGRVVLFLVTLVAFLASVVFLGYVISSLVFLYFFMHLMGYQDWRKMTVISATWVLVSYFVFARLLYVPLPVGRLFESLS